MRYDEKSCVCQINPHAANNEEKARSIRPCVLHRMWADQQMADARREALQEAMRAVEAVLMFDHKQRAQKAIRDLAPGQIEERP